MSYTDYEIPFGAKDSELIEATYYIPEGMEAVIEDNKVVIRKKDSEGEKTRKEIIDYVIVTLDDESSSKDRWLAWLEKQGKENPLKGTLGDVFDDLRAGLDPSPKQGEQKPTLTWEDIDKLEDIINQVHSENPNGISAENFGMEVIERFAEDFAPKVEPKFKVGDWVVWDNKISCHIYNIYQGKESLMYTITDTHNMTRSYSVKGFDNNAHLWTIDDAKDGDVLLFEGYYNSIVLFQGIGINGKGRINYHCKCDLGDYSFGIQGDVACLGTIEEDAEHYHPATKEQKELLFQKMKEAGYEWDNDKKELKKIEQKQEWSEEDKALIDNICTALKGYALHERRVDLDEHAQRLEEMAKKLKSLRPQPKQEWTEEDEKIMNMLIASLVRISANTRTDSTSVNYSFIKEINWLKSLKERLQ